MRTVYHVNPLRLTTLSPGTWLTTTLGESITHRLTIAQQALGKENVT